MQASAAPAVNAVQAKELSCLLCAKRLFAAAQSSQLPHRCPVSHGVRQVATASTAMPPATKHRYHLTFCTNIGAAVVCSAGCCCCCCRNLPSVRRGCCCRLAGSSRSKHNCLISHRVRAAEVATATSCGCCCCCGVFCCVRGGSLLLKLPAAAALLPSLP
jgi:hypothetical protein